MGFKVFRLERNSSQDIFNCIFLKANFGILIWVSMKFVAKGPVDSKSVLVLGPHPANERHRYKVAPSLIGWTQT